MAHLLRNADVPIANFPRNLNGFLYFRLLPKVGFVKNPIDFTNFRFGCQLSVPPMMATETFFVGHGGTKGSLRYDIPFGLSNFRMVTENHRS